MRFYYCVEREKNPDWFSQAIMDQIKAPYSHALVLMSDIPSDMRERHKLPAVGDVIFHATIPKYTFIGVAEELDNGANEIYDMIEIKVQDECFALGWLLGNMDKEYSFSQCIGMLDFGLFDEHFKRKLAEIWGNDAGRGVCSELPVRFGMACSVLPEFFANINPEGTNPKKGLKLFKELYEITSA